MKVRFAMAFFLGVAAMLLLQTRGWAGEKGEKKPEKSGDVTINGELANTDDKDKVRTQCYCKTYKFKMTEGKSYQIDMKSTDVDSYLRLEDPQGTQVAADDDGGGFPDARITYKAPKTGEYTIICTTFGDNSTGKFTMTAKSLVVKDAKPIDLELNKQQAAEYKGELTAEDGRYNGKKIHKLFLYPMEQGKTYRIDHSSQAFDAYLYLEDPDGKVVAQNDDNGESLDSRIVFEATKAGKYRIIATSLGGQGKGNFTLTVRPATEQDKQFSALQKKLNELFVNPKNHPEVVADVVKFLQSKGTKLNNSDVRLAMDVSQILEFTKNEKAAGEALKQFTKIFAQADDSKVVQAGKLMEGTVRRMSLLGNEMEIKGKLLDGKDFDLKNLKGKVVLVDFWATWCGPCVGEIPNIKKLHEKYNKQGFEVIGISLDNSMDELKKFIAKENLPWPSIYDMDEKRTSVLSNHYGVTAIPFAVLVGRDGRVVSTNARGSELTRLLDEIFTDKK